MPSFAPSTPARSQLSLWAIPSPCGSLVCPVGESGMLMPTANTQTGHPFQSGKARLRALWKGLLRGSEWMRASAGLSSRPLQTRRAKLAL